MKNISLLAVATLLLFAGACKKKTTEDTKPTGVITCKINGQAWQSGPASSTIKFDGVTRNYTSAQFTGDTLLLSGIRNEKDTSGIYFYVKVKSGKVGMVSGTATAFFPGIYLKYYDINSLVQTLTDYVVTYELNITKYDTGNKTISGTFIINMTGAKGTISVTEGQFTDVKYK